MMIFAKPSPSGIAAAFGRSPTRLELTGPVSLAWESSDRDLPPGEMNDPVDTYASCMQDQLNR